MSILWDSFDSEISFWSAQYLMSRDKGYYQDNRLRIFIEFYVQYFVLFVFLYFVLCTRVARYTGTKTVSRY